MGGYYGTDKIETTTDENTELIPKKKSNWTINYSFKDLYLDNKTDCTIIVNDGDPIFLEAEDGFQINKTNTPIRSLVIVESGVSYKWSGNWS